MVGSRTLPLKMTGDRLAHTRNWNPDYRFLGAILFWVIDKFCPDARLAQLLRLLVVLVCLGAIVARLLPLLGYPSFLSRHAGAASPCSCPSYRLPVRLFQSCPAGIVILARIAIF